MKTQLTVFNSRLILLTLYILSLQTASLSAQTVKVQRIQKQVEQTEEVKLIQSSETSVTIEFTPKWLPDSPREIGGTTYTQVQFRNSISDRSFSGLPDARFFTVPIVVGSSKQPRVEILSSQSDEIKNSLLAPAPFEDSKGNATYRVSENYSAQPIEKLVAASAPNLIRNYNISQIKFSPIQFDAVYKTIRKFNKIVVRISFDEFAERKNSPNSFDENIIATALNYKLGKFWQTSSNEQNFKRQPSSQSKLSSVGSTQSVLRSGKFFKLEIKEEGLYKLDKAYLDGIGLNTSSIDPKKIKIYFNGGDELDPSNSSSPIDDLRECAILVQGETDGTFDSGDYVLFYAHGISGVKYQGGRLKHYLNRFSNSTYAFLTVDGANGKRVGARASLQAAAPFVPTTFQTLVFSENDRVNTFNTGINFYDTPLNSSRRSAVYPIDLPGLDQSQVVSYRYQSASQQPTNEIVTLSEGQSTSALGSYILYATSEFNPVYYLLEATSQTNGTNIIGGQSRFTVEYSGQTASSQLFSDWVEITYNKLFQAQSNQLKFNSLVRGLTSTQIVEYRLQGFTSSPQVWDISKLDSAVAITGTTYNSGQLSFQSNEVPNVYRELIAFTLEQPFRKPISSSVISNQNLRSLADQTNPRAFPEYIIIYGSDFESQAQRLLNYRTDQSIWGNLALKGTSIEVGKIYNEFSGGKQDISTIRDFLKLLYDNAPNANQRPKYVLLFGDGDWDYRDITGRRYSKVPMHEGDQNEYNSDDFFVDVQGFGRFIPEIAIGRLTVQTPSEAKVAVDKIISYETESDQGDWRNKAGFVADDGPNGNEGSNSNRFSIDSENTILSAQANSPYIYASKLYLGFYKSESAAGGKRRPAAATDIISQINSGLLAINFIGHGNPNVWTAEQVLQAATSIPQMVNRNKLTFGITATCDFGRGDDPNVQSGAERMFITPNGGAVGLVTTSRSIFISSGTSATPKLASELFRRSVNNGLLTIGQSYLAFKLRINGGEDSEKFYLLGDPAMRLITGKTISNIDSINSVPLPVANPIQIKALSKTTIAGSIRDGVGNVVSGFNGNATVAIYDAPRRVGADHEGVGTFDQFYNVQNSLIYRGQAEIRNGYYTINFMVPKDIAYDSTNAGKISVYAWKSNSENRDTLSTASGSTEDFFAAGTNENAVSDKDGPLVDVYLNDKSFSSGAITNENPLFVAELYDQNGINLTQSVGHAITLTLNGDEQNPVILNEYYQAKSQSFTDGEIRYPFRNLKNGNYSLRFKVWDTYNNSSEKTVNFTVQNSSSLSVGNVYNFPNPFKQQTTFVFAHNQTGQDLESQIKIYTVAGRLIKKISQTDMGSQAQVKIPWDGRDEDGSELANGIYLYKLSVKSLSGSFRAEKIEKLAIVR